MISKTYWSVKEVQEILRVRVKDIHKAWWTLTMAKIVSWCNYRRCCKNHSILTNHLDLHSGLVPVPWYVQATCKELAGVAPTPTPSKGSKLSIWNQSQLEYDFVFVTSDIEYSLMTMTTSKPDDDPVQKSTTSPPASPTVHSPESPSLKLPASSGKEKSPEQHINTTLHSISRSVSRYPSQRSFQRSPGKGHHEADEAAWGSNFWVTLVDPQVCPWPW